MRKVLYLVSRVSGPLDMLPLKTDASVDSSVVLIEEAVKRQNVPGSTVLALVDQDQPRSGVTYPIVTTSDLVRMIFESDSVVSL